MRLPGKKWAQRSFRQMRSRLFGGIVVLGYHRIGGEDDAMGLAVSARNFAAHLDVIARSAQPLRLSEAVRAAASGTMPKRGVVMTFDDGYRDTYEDARPMLEHAGIPATVFVTTGYAGREFWWDELARMLLHSARLPPRLDVEIRGRLRSWKLGTGSASSREAGDAERRLALQSLARDLRVLRRVERETVMDALRVCGGLDPPGESARPRALTADELRGLAASPRVEIGAHTVSHTVLSALTPSEQRQEIQQSRAELQDLTGSSVTSFSYPHGGYSARTLSIVSEAGFLVACGSTPDVVRPRSSPLELPRLWVGNQDGESFASWLGAWLPR